MTDDADFKYPCKIGTMPMVIFAIDRRTPFEVGRRIRIKERRGAHWTAIIIRRIDDDGYFQADRF